MFSSYRNQSFQTNKLGRYKTVPVFLFYSAPQQESWEDSELFKPEPSSDVDALGKKRYVGKSNWWENRAEKFMHGGGLLCHPGLVKCWQIPPPFCPKAPHVIYQTGKKPDEPCSITSSLNYFPEDEPGESNVNAPPKSPPSNLTVVTVEGCPSFVILDWEKTDNDTTGTNRNEQIVQSESRNFANGSSFVGTRILKLGKICFSKQTWIYCCCFFQSMKSFQPLKDLTASRFPSLQPTRRTRPWRTLNLRAGTLDIRYGLQLEWKIIDVVLPIFRSPLSLIKPHRLLQATNLLFG